MALPQQWNTLLHLKRSDFQYPDQLRFPVVSALDHLITLVGSMPVILSDYRPGDPRQHGKGTAIDTTWPGADPLGVYNLALSVRLFTGIGIYLNEQDAVSFHFDTRTDRTVDNPALWGDFITYPYSAEAQTHVRRDEYTSAQMVIDVLKKKTATAMLAVAGFAFGLYLLTRKGS